MLQYTRVNTGCVRFINAFMVIGLCLLFVGCADINYLRDAQSAFNDAASAENRLRQSTENFKTTPSESVADGPVQDTAGVQAAYASVVLSLDKLEGSKDLEKLKADGLYGNVLVLKAMSYWRLAQYDKAKASAIKALNTSAPLGPRDQAMMQALPGLIRNDQAYAMIYIPDAPTGDTAAWTRDVISLLTSAAPFFDKARKGGLPEDHPMQIYLIQSQLAGVKNMISACEVAHKKKTSAIRRCTKDAGTLCKAQTYFNDLKKVVGQSSLQIPQDVQRKLLQNWALWTGASVSLPAGVDPCN